MRHPRVSFRSSIPSLHLGKKTATCRRPCCRLLDNWDWRTSVFLRLYTRSDPGCWRARWWCAPCPLLRALSQEGECVRKPGQLTPPHWSPQVKQTASRTCSRSQTHTTQWFPTEMTYYTKLENSGGLWCSSMREGVFWVSNKTYRNMKRRSWYQKYATSPFSGKCFSLGEKHVNTPHILTTNFS